MPNLPKSSLPEEPEYWDALARRITQDGAGPLTKYAAVQEIWVDVLARRAAWWVAASLAAMLTLWLSLPASGSPGGAAWIERSLAPHDRAGALLGGSTPPSVDELMAQFPPPPESPLDNIIREERQ